MLLAIVHARCLDGKCSGVIGRIESNLRIFHANGRVFVMSGVGGRGRLGRGLFRHDYCCESSLPKKKERTMETEQRIWLR